MQLRKNEREIVQVERACGELRRGMPVQLVQENGGIMVASPDNIMFISNLLNNANSKNRKLIVSGARANYLFPAKNITKPLALNIDDLSAEDIFSICSLDPCKISLNDEKCVFATEIELQALKLAKIAELIPAIITCDLAGKSTEDFIKVTANSISCYANNVHYSMHEACRTTLSLAYAAEAQIIAYRPNVGGPEHYAIIIGKPGLNPIVRVHSSCYTGDLLASLDCDCRDQLQSAIELMDKSGGGIIIYLMQEGRGIGLVNKLRTYSLQDKGMDTVDANRALGFDDDERLFLPAAEILKKNGLYEIRLLTNNPHKAAGLEEYGIKVTECVPHIMQSNIHNKAYLQTKADRLGHKI